MCPEETDDADKMELGNRVRELRRKCKMTLRDLSAKSGIAPSYLSNLERGVNSPTLATLHKVLAALDTDMENFFTAANDKDSDGFVFVREKMRTVSDEGRRYTFLLPKREDIKAEVLEEYVMPQEVRSEFETLRCDIAGMLLDGVMELEVDNEKKAMLRGGDAFYIPAGRRHRGRCISSEPVRLITIYVPPKY